MTASHQQRQAAQYGLEFAEPPAPPTAPARPATSPRKVVTPPDHIAGPSHRDHGTRAKYVGERCRCDACREAVRVYERQRIRAISRPDEAWVPYVPAGPARRHCHALMAQGIGAKSIAKLSGVPHGAVSKLLYGDYVRGTKPSKRIRPDTARRILAVTVDQAAGAQKIDATDTWRMLDDLIARGWAKKHLAELIVGPTAVSLQIRRDTIRASTARKVEQVYAQIKDTAVPAKRSRWSK